MHFAEGWFVELFRQLLKHIKREDEIECARIERNFGYRRLCDLAEAPLANQFNRVSFDLESVDIPEAPGRVMAEIVTRTATGIEDADMRLLQFRGNDRIGDLSHCREPPELVLEFVQQLEIFRTHVPLTSNVRESAGNSPPLGQVPLREGLAVSSP